MATPTGIAAAARQAATGFALRAPPSASCRAPVDLHHFLGHQQYNRSPNGNPLKLLPAIQLYENPAYRRLVSKFGIDKVFILSAGWGLIPADFLTPTYDITFSQSADDYKRRRKSDLYRDLSLFPADSDEALVFLGGKDYLPLFVALTRRAKGPRVVLYNSMNRPDAPGCNLQRYVTTTRTNWHYECAQALIEGRLGLPKPEW